MLYEFAREKNDDHRLSRDSLLFFFSEQAYRRGKREDPRSYDAICP